MKLFLIEQKESIDTIWDTYDGFVIIAKSKELAIKLVDFMIDHNEQSLNEFVITEIKIEDYKDSYCLLSSFLHG